LFNKNIGFIEFYVKENCTRSLKVECILETKKCYRIASNLIRKFAGARGKVVGTDHGHHHGQRDEDDFHFFLEKKQISSK
jgi:hypothetical protein